jgi:putative tricarboxylic transport membrane protein
VRPLARSGDFWSGLVLAAIGAYIVVQARAWDYMTEEGPGPGFFPMWYGSAMVVLSLLLVAGAVLKRPAGGGTIVWAEVSRAMLCWAAFVVCIALMRYVGFIVAFGLLTWFMAAVMGGQPQRRAIAIAVGGAIGFYALFDRALDVSLPLGSLFS